MSVLRNGSSMVSLDSLSTVSVSTSSGTLGSGQQWFAKVPASGSKRGLVIYCHGAGSANEGDMNGLPPCTEITSFLAARGFVCLGGRMGGPTYGNDISNTCIDELIAHGVGTLGADGTYGTAFLGSSMGNASACSWAGNGNQADTNCIVSIVGLCDTKDLHDRDPLGAGLAAEIEAAAGGAGNLPTWYPTHSPKDLAAAGALDGIPIRVYYGSTDTLVPGSTVTPVIADCDEGAAIQVTGNHATGLVAHGLLGAMAGFIIGNYPPTGLLRKALTA